MAFEGGKIDGRQATNLFITLILSEEILLVPAMVIQHARQDSWLSALIALAGGLLIGWTVITLTLRFPGKTWFEYLEDILGKLPGKIVGFIFIWGYLHFTADIMREYASLLTSAFMPETPLVAFLIMGTILGAYIVYNGLEVLARVNQLFFLVIIGSMVLLLLLPIPDMKVTNLLPVFDTGLTDIIKGSMAPMFWFGQIYPITMVIPYLSQPQESYRIAFKSLLISWVFFEVIILGLIALFGPEVAASYVSPVLNEARMIHLANFIERLELLLMTAWIMGGVVKFSLLYWSFSLGSAQLLGLKDYRPLILPLGLILISVSVILHPNVLHLVNFLARTWPPSGITYVGVVPLILLIIAWVRGVGGKAQ